MNIRLRRSLVNEISILCLVIILATFGCTEGKEDKSKKIDSLISAYNDYDHFHGTILVAENGKIIIEKGYGLASREWEMPHGPDTKFRIASITKTFTAILIMQLVDAQKVDLEGKITDYLPFYRHDTGEKVTIHHLLSHSSGIPDYLRIPGFWQNQMLLQHSRDEFVKKYCSGDLEFEPGTQYRYNNSGYYLLGLIVEKVTSNSFETVLQENIIIPSGMKNTGMDNNRVVLKNRATGYVKSGFDFRNVPYLNIENSFSAGQMYSTAKDLFLFDRALHSDLLLSAQYRELLFTPHFYYSKHDYSIGYDWELGKIRLAESEDSVSYAQHLGGLNGFNTMFCRLLDDGQLIILLGNLDSAPLKEIRQEITNILYDRPFAMPLKSIAREMYNIIVGKDVASAMQAYHSIRAEHTDEYNMGERELNAVGYYLLRNNKQAEAIQIFRLNVEVYPEYANGWDSLGEAYMLNGEKELSIQCYQKCLSLDPNNQNAANMLKKLAD